MRKRLVVAALLSAVVTLGGAPAQAGSDFPCVGTVVGGVYENVVVPEGGFCNIRNAQIRGNLKALSGSTLFVSGGNTIQGNVEGDHAQRVDIFHRAPSPTPNIIYGNGVIVADPQTTFVCGALLPNGNIVVVKSRGGVLSIGGAGCGGSGEGNTVERGNIKVEDNIINGLFEVARNHAGQNLQVYKTTGTATKRVQNNTAGESVQCFDNAAPFVGGPNFAPKVEGQCF
jgi:hypothetical protein